MPSTPRIGHTYPDRNQRDWFSAFESFAASVDASDYAARDDRNLVVIGGDPIKVSQAGLISWASDIYVHHPSSGVSGVISQAQSGVDISDGEMVYVTLVRSPGGEYDLTLKSTQSKIPNDDNSFILFFRKQNEVWVRDRGVAEVGQTVGVSGDIRNSIQLALSESQGEGDRVLGRTKITPEDFAYSGGEVTLSIYSEAQTTEDHIAGEIRLYDVTSGDTLLATHYVAMLPPEGFHYEIDLSSVSGRRTYELRGGLYTFALPQIVDAQILQAEDGVTYRYVNDDTATNYDYVALSTDSVGDIAAGLAAAIDADLDLTATSGEDTVRIQGPDGVEFLYHFEVLNASSIVDDYIDDEIVQHHSVGAPYTDSQELLVWHSTFELVVSL